MLLSPYKAGRDWDPQLDPQIYFLKTGRLPYSGVYRMPALLIAQAKGESLPCPSVSIGPTPMTPCPPSAGTLSLESHDHKAIVQDISRAMIGSGLDDAPTMGETGLLANIIIQVWTPSYRYGHNHPGMDTMLIFPQTLPP